jgi:hypothetical protein
VGFYSDERHNVTLILVSKLQSRVSPLVNNKSLIICCRWCNNESLDKGQQNAHPTFGNNGGPLPPLGLRNPHPIYSLYCTCMKKMNYKAWRLNGETVDKNSKHRHMLTRLYFALVRKSRQKGNFIIAEHAYYLEFPFLFGPCSTESMYQRFLAACKCSFLQCLHQQAVTFKIEFEPE